MRHPFRLARGFVPLASAVSRWHRLYSRVWGKPRKRRVLCVSQSRELSRLPLPIYEGIGVGVYEGEPVVIRRWVGTPHRPQMVVYRLLPQDFGDISEELILRLCRLAHSLALQKQQSCEPQRDSQETSAPKLEPYLAVCVVSHCPICSSSVCANRPKASLREMPE